MNKHAPSQGQDLQEGVYRTPMNLLVPIHKRWRLDFDLAAHPENNVVDRLCPRELDRPRYFTEADNALAQPWNENHLGMAPQGYAWLNPPYDDIGQWTAKAEAEAKLGARVVMLIPSATGAKWLVDHCLNAQIVFLIGRPVFEFLQSKDSKQDKNGNYRYRKGDPNTDPYPKDLLLVVFDGMRGVQWWDWRKK